MDLDKLKQAETNFFFRFPGGFNNPELIQIRKKHNLSRMFELARDSFAENNFKSPGLIVENMIKVITRSSLVSVFEKTKFRNFASTLSDPERQQLSKGLEEQLHGEERTGFEIVLEILQRGRLAKWSLLTICPAYYHPQRAVFIKPTTTKEILRTFALDHLHYHPTPTWSFYEQYRTALDEMKSKLDPSLSPYYIAFTGFLMRSIRERLF